jgi:DNA-binding beta-propeller fold protein YncE
MTYREQPGWAADLHWEQRPDAISHRDVAGVAVDAADQVYLFTRYDHQVLVYTAAGEFVRAWGAGSFTNAHSIQVGPDGAVYCVDNGDHSVRKFTQDGELLLTLGVPGTQADTGYRTDVPVRIHNVETVARAAGPFNGCTDVAVGPGGDIFVSDGYGNCRVHHFSPAGKLLNSWGEIGSGPGQFMLPHGICLTPDGRLLVADRENERIQVFRTDGRYLEEWPDVQRPSSIALTPQGDVVVAELWRPADNTSFVADTAGTDQPGRMSLLSPRGEVLDRWGASADDKAAAGNVIAPHMVAVDSTGSVYVGEVTYTYGIKLGRVGEDHAPHQVQKFTAPQAEG